MKRPNVKAALVGIFTIFAILFALTGYVSLRGMQTLHNDTQDFAKSIEPGVSRAKDIQLARYSLRGSYSDYAIGRTSGDPAALEKKITEREAKLLKTVQAYKPLVDSDTERKSFEKIDSSSSKYLEEGRKMMALTQAGKTKEAIDAFDNDLGPVADILADNVDILVKYNEDRANDATAESGTQYASTLTLISSILVLSGLLVCVASYFGIAGIATPVGRITKAMRDLAQGDTASEISDRQRRDEIGEMANAVEVFRQAAIENKTLQAEAETTRAKTEADRSRLTAEAEAAAQSRLNEATAGLASGLRRLAAGDLAFQLTEPFAPEFEALRHDLNGAVMQLADTLGAVSQSADAINGGTQEISRGSDDLSKRTEQQAASLEQTAAALDQITVNVSNSSKRADEARQVAIQANEGAAQSGKVVANAVDAMQKIEHSSNQISSIIGVIDEIAFQTNLLALNAGVEAARAGEAGRGFAVVAQEVRELAQRSAQAAKQIKELIRNSSAEVEGGVKHVRETGEALKAIEGLVVIINRHMDAIATSSREQSTGLSEVNNAVNQMDQFTQQNAAMVEETNAASATLASEAARMTDLISRFQFGAEATPVAALRQMASTMGEHTQNRTTRPGFAVRGNTALKR